MPWTKFGRAGAGAMVLAILTPLVLLSETRIKEAIESIFAGCLFVVDIRPGQTANPIIVHGYMIGKPPAGLNLTFHARQELIERVEFKSGILASPPTPNSIASMSRLRQSAIRKRQSSCTNPSRDDSWLIDGSG
jgi:hypothetical protein